MNATEAITLKVSVSRGAWLGRKKLSTWTARLGNTEWKASGTCKQGAIETLFAELVNAEENMLKRKYVRKGNVTFVLYYAGGWWYDIVRDDGTSSACGMVCNSYREAEERMMRHVEQHDGI